MAQQAAAFSNEGSALKKSKFHIFSPKKHPHIKTTEKPDCIMGYHEVSNPRVQMVCGHAFCAETIFQMVRAMFEKDLVKTQLQCPIPECRKEWEWRIIKAAGAFTGKEIQLFTKWLALRSEKQTTKRCPSCQSCCERPASLAEFRVACVCRKRDFCWQCGNFWKGSGMQLCKNEGCSVMEVQKTLDNCKMIETMGTGTTDCPSVRACPSCLSIIAWVEKCKRMKCTACASEFCFRCLGKKRGASWPCGSYANKCPIKPKQKLG